MFPLLGNKFILMHHLDYNNGNGVSLRGLCRDVINKGQSQWRKSSARQAVKKGPERVKLRISSAISHYHGKAGEDTTGWERHSGYCGDL
jgi:hypothetical protein